MPGLLDSLTDDPTMSFAMGLLNASGPSARPVSLGQGIAQGYGAMSEAKQNQMKAKQAEQMMLMHKFQMDQMQQSQAKMLEQQKFIATLPEAQQQAIRMGVDPTKMWERLNPEYKPQLVEVADPADPLRTVKKWMAPGQTDGVVAGYGSMPEILDPRVQKAKTAISAAGASRTEVKMPAMETEQQKALGKGWGEMRNDLNNSAMQAPKSLQNIARMEQLLAGVEGGKLAPMGAEISSAAQSLGFKVDPKLGNKQAAEALAVEMAMAYRQPGTGPMTDKDFENFQKMVPGLSKTAEGRKQIMSTMKAKINRDREVAKLARAYASMHGGNLDDGFLDKVGEYYANNPIFSGESVTSKADAILGRR